MKKCLLITILFSSLCLLSAMAQNTKAASGKCNGDVEWTFDGRTLYISSLAPKKNAVSMPDYDLDGNRAPWIKQNLAIRKVVIGVGIGTIGSCAFANCEELNTVEIQYAMINEIGWGAFLNCRNLFNFSMPPYVKRIATVAFANCSSLRSVSIPSLTRVEDMAFLSCTNLNVIEVGNNAMLGKAVFATEVMEDGRAKHIYYKGEIRNLPRNINTENCAEYGLSQESVALFLKKSSPALMQERVSTVDIEIPEPLVVRNDTYALIIGNENYRHVAAVPYAQNDATVFAEYCKKTLGIPASNIMVSLDATKHIILEELLGDWCNEVPDRRLKKLVVFYAGHGVPDIQDNNKSYLLPTDVKGSKPNHGIALDEFYDKLGRLGFANVTVFLDACFSGVNRDNESLVVERAVEVEAQDAKPTVGNMIVLAATHGNETAQNYPDEGHGLFTYYLLKELQETQGMVTLGKLAKDINNNVKNVARTLPLGKSQTPMTFTSYTNDDWKQMSL